MRYAANATKHRAKGNRSAGKGCGKKAPLVNEGGGEEGRGEREGEGIIRLSSPRERAETRGTVTARRLPFRQNRADLPASPSTVRKVRLPPSRLPPFPLPPPPAPPPSSSGRALASRLNSVFFPSSSSPASLPRSFQLGFPLGSFRSLSLGLWILLIEQRVRDLVDLTYRKSSYHYCTRSITLRSYLGTDRRRVNESRIIQRGHKRDDDDHLHVTVARCRARARHLRLLHVCNSCEGEKRVLWPPPGGD